MIAIPTRIVALAILITGAHTADLNAQGAARARQVATAPDTTGRPPGGPFDRLHFRSIGPASMSGRIDDIAVLERDPRIFYIAAATGGLWKTTNNGVSLKPVFDSAGTASIGSVTIPADDPNLVWIGTGENNNRQSSSWGDGVYKSTDGGAHWTNMGLRDSKQVARIVIDPVDHDVVYVAALGDLWKAGGERGIYKSTDGGVSWTRVLDAGPDAGGTELVMDPANNKTLYAATYQRRRASWGFNGGGVASGLWKSTDAGRTWTRLTSGLPEGAIGRIGIDIFRRNTSVIYARVEHPKQGGVYRSDDAGQTWKKMGSTNSRPMYFGIIRVDPENDLRIYSPATPLQVSDDGGKTFRSDGARTIHVDFHAMWINPKDASHMMLGGDGGVGITYDKGRTWMWLAHLPVGQFYHIGYDMAQPYNVCGGLQDNNTWCGPSATRSQHGIGNDSWQTVQGGDGFVGLIDPLNPRIVFAESQDGFVSRVDRVTLESKSIRPEAPPSEKPYRWNWDTPMMLSHTNPATIYVGGNKVFRSTDRGHTWTAISGDLTTAVDRDTIELMGVKGKDIKIAKNDGVEQYAALFSMAESRKKAGLIWTGSDDGQVHVTRDGGGTWTNVTSKIPGAPRFAYVSEVEPSRVDEGTAYVAFDAHRTGDYGTYLYVTTDFGATFRSIAGALPKGEVVRTVAEDQKNPDVLYVGTETGLWVSLDRGRGWTRVRANLPTVPIYEITQHSRDNAMILATHGRAIWILDDMSPLQTWNSAVAQSGWVFGNPGATLRVPVSDQERSFQGDMIFLGENPPMAATIAYYTTVKPDSVRIEIADGSGSVVRQVKGDTAKAKRPMVGLNLTQWDLRVEPLPALKRGEGTSNPFGGGSGREGPYVLPGTYVASVFVNGRKIGSTDVAVKSDPESQISAADRKANFELMKELQQLNGRLSDAVIAAKQVHTQLGSIRKELADSSATPAAFRATLDSLTTALIPLKKKFLITDEGEEIEFSLELFLAVLPFKLSGLAGDLSGFITGPSTQNLKTMDAVRREVPASVDETNALVTRFAAFVKQLSDAGIYPVMPKPVK